MEPTSNPTSADGTGSSSGEGEGTVSSDATNASDGESPSSSSTSPEQPTTAFAQTISPSAAPNAAAASVNVASAVVAGGALLFLVAGDPTAVEVQLLVLLLQSKDCASGWDRDATDVLRYFLAPFVFTGDMGAVVGNFAIVSCVAILHLVAVATYRAVATNRRGGGKKHNGGLPSWAEARKSCTLKEGWRNVYPLPPSFFVCVCAETRGYCVPGP